MEFLMTYGWAILILSVVLVSLYGLGIFSPGGVTPRVSPGGCQIYRPYGPGTTSLINPEGLCNNGLPQYVAYFVKNSNSFITTGIAGLPLLNSPRSVFAWVYLNNPSGAYTIYSYGTTACNERAWLYTVSGNVIFDSDCSSFTDTTTPAAQTWHFIGYTYSSGSVTIYVDGIAQTGSVSLLDTTLPSLNASDIGQVSNSLTVFLVAGSTYSMNGMISNVQVYNSSLSANAVAALYEEGIGGVPIQLNNLVGWWPLNGNANDYSGNLNNGVPTNVIFTTSWTSGYSAP